MRVAVPCSPSLLELVGFALSAVAAFSVLNLLVAHLLRSAPDDVTPTRALLIGTATDFLAVGAAVGTAIAIGFVATAWAAWVLAPFGASIIYIVVQALELAAGRRQTHDNA